jgi:hypothetical protein
MSLCDFKGIKKNHPDIFFFLSASGKDWDSTFKSQPLSPTTFISPLHYHPIT